MKGTLCLIPFVFAACSGEFLTDQAESDQIERESLALTVDANATYTIVSKPSGKCLGITSSSTANNATVELRTCNGSTAQKFRLSLTTTGYYAITNVNSGKCLDVNAKSTADGAAIIQYNCSGATNQQWAVADTTTGLVKLTARHSGKVMGPSGGATADGTAIVQQTWTGAAYQSVALTSVCTSGPIGAFSGALADGINFLDTNGVRVNAHGGGIIKVGDTFYMHGQYFLPGDTKNNFAGFSMYSSKSLSTWKNEGIIVPVQASGELGPNRKGERPHIIQCPATGEYVLYAHAADVTYQADKEVVYATSATINGQYSYKGPLKNSSGALIVHSDMSTFVDGSNAYVLTESGHVFTLSTDCHSWLSDKSFATVNGTSTGGESPTMFKAGSTYYWIMSNKTGWRANNNFYSTAPAVTGPWTYQGYLAPVTDPSNVTSDQRTWLSQSTWVMPIVGCSSTTYVYWGDHWYGMGTTLTPGLHNDLATYVFQPIVFNGTKISLPAYLANWKLDVGAGTYSMQ